MTTLIRKAFALFFIFTLLLLSACSDSREASSPEEPGTDSFVDFLPESTPEPEPSKPDDGIFTVRLPQTPFYTEPDASLEPEAYIDSGTKLRLLREEGSYMLFSFDDGRELWAHAWYLNAADPETEQQRESVKLSLYTSSPGFKALDEALYTSTASNLNCREAPSTASLVLCLIPQGTQVSVVGEDGDFCLCRLSDGSYVYCSKLYLTDGVLFAAVPNAVDLRQYLPEAEFELLFASENNIAGYPLYPAVPLLESTTAALLKKAFDIFYDDGYIIKIYDAYRPKSAQFILYDILPDYRYLANPYVCDSYHQLGRAVDISLVDKETGLELEMPTAMHCFTQEASRRDDENWSEAALKNVEYMTEVMQSVGFGIIDTEWWHFEYLGNGGYMNTTLDLNNIEYEVYPIQ